MSRLLSPLSYEPSVLRFNTISLLRDCAKFLQSSLRSFKVRQDVVRLRRADVGMAQDALNLFVVNAHFVQSCSESTAKCMPAEPCPVDVLWDVSSGEIVEIERPQKFFSPENPPFA